MGYHRKDLCLEIFVKPFHKNSIEYREPLTIPIYEVVSICSLTKEVLRYCFQEIVPKVKFDFLGV